MIFEVRTKVEGDRARALVLDVLNKLGSGLSFTLEKSKSKGSAGLGSVLVPGR